MQNEVIPSNTFLVIKYVLYHFISYNTITTNITTVSLSIFENNNHTSLSYYIISLT